MNKDIACGGAGVALAIGYFTLADDLPRSLLSDPTGADGLPKALAVVLGGLSLALILGAILRRGKSGGGTPRELSRHLRAVGLLGLGFLYLVLLPWLGYAATIFAFLLVISLYAGLRLGPTPLAVSAAGAFVLWFTFVHLFGIAMPSGALF